MKLFALTGATIMVAGASFAQAEMLTFKADLTMAGRWAFKIQAKVPGEAETVEGTVIFEAK